MGLGHRHCHSHLLAHPLLQVYSDLLTNPLLVPLKILRGHTVTDYAGVLDCAFHPTQPWLFTAGGDGNICLFCN